MSLIENLNNFKNLPIDKLNVLSDEIREFLIESVSKTGGHLSSNLGTVDLTIALHKVFNTPNDKIIFDVGHQCYTHKILTGRVERFSTLRQENGLSGFPNPKESIHDAFNAGHANTSISAAIGIARAKKLKGETDKVIAIVGDGAFTGGMIYEAMNNIDDLDNLIVILNDNTMSISKNVGALSRYFTTLRSNPRYYRAKKVVETFLNDMHSVGKVVKDTIVGVKSSLRRVVYNSTFFEEMGFQYIGTLDGHDIEEMVSLFENFKLQQEKPAFVHIVTTKGKGFEPAEQNPGEFHGVSAFDVNNIPDPHNPDNAPADSFSNVFGRKLVEISKDEDKICAITAAMKYGTGLQFFYKQFKDRFFDVGIAEQHGVTFAAGLASQGMIPVVAMYSTFLQRGYDQLLHDVILQQENVLFAIDRAGLVPGDGETHQGVYDPAFLSQIENFILISPSNYEELEYWLEKLVKEYNIPRAIRYPRGKESEVLAKYKCTTNTFDKIISKENAKIAMVSYASEVEDVITASNESNKDIDVYKLIQISPLSSELVDDLLQYEIVLFAEECVKNGGIGEHLLSALSQKDFKGKFIHVATPNLDIDHASVSQLKIQLGLDAKSLIKTLEEKL